ncbi:ead/Ea22-like family protein [Salmonella enterica]
MTALNKHRELRKELSNPAIGSNHHLRKLAMSLLDELETKEEQRANWFQMAQKLGEDLDAAEKRNAEQREYYDGVIADGSNRIAELEKGHQEAAKQINSWRRLAKQNIAERGKDISELEAARQRIAELERSETQLISERDDAESALNDAYKAVMGQAPEWSNWFSFENAIDEIELACELWRNQTDDVIQFRQRIAELEAKLSKPVLLPKTNGYWTEQEKAYEEAITLAKRQVRLAGFNVEEM